MTHANMNSDIAAVQVQYKVYILELEQLPEVQLQVYSVFCSENYFTLSFFNFFLDLLLRAAVVFNRVSKASNHSVMLVLV